MFGQFFVSALRSDRVYQLCLFFFIFGIRGLVSFKSFVEGGVFDPRDIVSDHDGELHVAHCIAAAVGSEVFFDFSQPMPAARPVRVAASRTVLTSLLSDMVVYICEKNYSSSSSSHARRLYAFGQKGLLFIFLSTRVGRNISSMTPNVKIVH